jgi:hypothetical protein
MFARMNVRCPLATFLLAFSVCSRLQGMDRWSALSQIESGDDDHAVGATGEVSRYQMKPEVWQRYAQSKADWTNPDDALSVARQAMQERCAEFERTAQRPRRTWSSTFYGTHRRRFNGQARRCPGVPSDSVT